MSVRDIGPVKLQIETRTERNHIVIRLDAFLPSTLCVPHKHSREIPLMPNDEVDEVTVEVELPTIVRLLRSSNIW